MRYYQEATKRFKKLDKLHLFLESKELSKTTNNDSLSLILYDNKIIINFQELDGLSKARRIAKECYADWTDKINNVWDCGFCIITSWYSSKHPYLVLWLECKVEDYPKSLLKSGCHFVTKSRGTRTNLVCDLT